MLYNIKEIDNDNKIDVTNITNYQNYFDTNSVKVKDICKVILQFIGYYNKPKNVLDKIASRHDICYELKPKNKGLCDRIMVKSSVYYNKNSPV